MISSTRPGEKISPSLGEEFSEPIERDNQVHIEYVPTQVVTEYLLFGSGHHHVGIMASPNGTDAGSLL
jgi:hypothetical protein